MTTELASLWVLALALLATGALTGLLAGLLGIGGGLVIVPVMHAVLTGTGTAPDVALRVAVGTSLAIILPTSLSSGLAHWRRGAVDVPRFRQLAPPAALGVLVGASLAAHVRGVVLTLLFAALALTMSVRFAVTTARRPARRRLRGAVAPRVIGFFIGLLSSMLGIGGGTLTVPTLTALGVPMKRAVGTSSWVGLLIALPGALTFAYHGLGTAGRPPGSFGYVHILGFLLVGITATLTAPLGARLVQRWSPVILRRGFAVFLLIAAAKMLWSLLPAT